MSDHDSPSDATRTLFIEELDRAVGGACNDPGATPPATGNSGPLTTFALGEEGAPPLGGVGTPGTTGTTGATPPATGSGPLTTFGIGEEGAPPIGGV